jgi:hypothetical protein
MGKGESFAFIMLSKKYYSLYETYQFNKKIVKQNLEISVTASLTLSTAR